MIVAIRFTNGTRFLYDATAEEIGQVVADHLEHAGQYDEEITITTYGQRIKFVDGKPTYQASQL